MTFILLYSVSQDQFSTRCFKEFETKEELAKTIVDFFENYLATVGRTLIENDNQATPNGVDHALSNEVDENGDNQLEYASDDLFKFMDSCFAELVCLQRQEGQVDLWIPYTTAWVKEAVYLYLRVQFELTQQLLDENEAQGGETPAVAENMDVDRAIDCVTIY